jgi:hypothetical protein
MITPIPSDWRVEIITGGRDGQIGYYEGSHSASFYWEFGSADVLVIIHIGKPSTWGSQFPWAADRQREISERVAQEVIRQRAPACVADIDERSGHIYIRGHNRAA